MFVLASAEAIPVAAITAAATLVAASVIARVTVLTMKDRLRHDRELADIDDLSKLLDEAAIALDRAVPAELVDLSLTPHPRQLAKRRMDDDARALDALHAQLAVRLGPREGVTLTLGEAIDCLRAIGREIPRGEGALSAQSPEVRKAKAEHMSGAMHALRMSAAAFVEAAVERAGTVATQTGTSEAATS